MSAPPAPSPVGKTSRRKRRAWLSVWYTAGGIAVLTALAWWVQVSRDTDLVDPTRNVTARAKSSTNVVLPPIRFRDVAAEMGISMRHGPGERSRKLPEDTGSGLAWGDYDGDGDPDLYLVNFPGPLHEEADPAGSNRLFRNDGDHFTDVTAAAGVGDLAGFGMGATFADYDGDGDLDLYVTNFGPNRLYRNQGDGTFQDVAEDAGVADPLWSTGAAWGDFDRDGDLDLYVCNYLRYDDGGLDLESAAADYGGGLGVPFTLNPASFDPEPNRLYRNRGDGTFEEVAESYDVHNPRGRSLAATFCDLDGDGWLDLYVNNDVSTNKLYQNTERDSVNGAPLGFIDLSAITGTADPRGSMGLSVGEIGEMGGDADGLPDLFITHWVAQENAFYQSLLTPAGELEYRDKTRQFRLGEVSIDYVGWGTALVDFDLDGRLDLAVANGSTLERQDNPRLLTAEPLFLFWNDGQRFCDVAATAGAATSGRYWARGLAAADFDGDGDVDLAVAVNRGQPLLLRNETITDHHSLTVLLDGPAAACFGAQVTVVVQGRRQVRWSGADASYLSMHGPEMIFGLGANASADEVSVTWADGRRTALRQVPLGRVIVAHATAESEVH